MKTSLFSNERVLYIDNTVNISYKRGFLHYRSSSEEKKCLIGGKYNSFSMLERMTRKEPRCAARIDKDHFLISFDGHVLNYCVSSNSVSIEHEYSKGMNNPLEFLSITNNKTGDNSVYYGEYIWNKDKGPVSVYKRNNNQWSCIYTFPANTITHIHNVVYDEYRNGLLILTGDEDSESGIWFLDNNSMMIKPLLLGSQQYRACIAFPDANGVFYATDTPLEDNYIYYLQLNEAVEVVSLRKEYKMPGPCIYGCKHNRAFYFSTSVEPDSSLCTLRYRFSYKLGRGVKDRYVHIIKRNPNGMFVDICQFKKDILPMWMFQFGNALYPQNESDRLYTILQSTTRGHGVTILLEE